MAEKRTISYCTGKQSEGQPVYMPNARWCATLSELAYHSQPEIEKKLPEYGYFGTDVAFFRNSLTQGFIIEFDNVIAVSFKGSVTWREWLNNFNLRLKRTPYGRIHAGLYQTIEQIGPAILQIVLPRLKEGKKLVVTGHSRGGALAILFAMMALLNGQDTDAVITFGSPKFCDGTFAAFAEKYRAQVPITRFVNGMDPVPRLPSMWVIPAIFLNLPLGFALAIPRIYTHIWRRTKGALSRLSRSAG